MGFRGESIGVTYEQAGLQHGPNIDGTLPNVLVHPTRNVNLQNGVIESRGGTATVDAAIAGTPRIMGGFDFLKSTGAQFQVRYAADGSVYSNPTTTIKTGLSTSKKGCFVQVDNVLYFCNGADAPFTWDGVAAGTSAFTHTAADWSTEQPFQLFLHTNGTNRRLVALTTGAVYFSAHNNFGEYVTGVVKLAVNVKGGLVGGYTVGSQIFLFGREKTLIVDTSDMDATKWGYTEAPWVGGAAHWRLIIPSANDILCVTEDGVIYSVARVKDYGNYQSANLARPAYIDRWLQEQASLTNVADWHAVYDPMRRLLKIFIVRAGATQVKAALIYAVDRPPDRAWSVHENPDYASGYNASCSFLVRVGVGDWEVYTGDYAGRLWKLETANKNDNNNPFTAGFRTPHMTFGDARREKRFLRGWLVMEPLGAYDYQVKIWVDGQYKTTVTVSMAATGAALGSFVLGTDVLGGRTVVKSGFLIGYRGTRIQFEVYNSSANQPFRLSQILVDLVPLGARPQ